ncbi:hypothetical protein [Aporhodopirellula aestuarii]|uniref:Uncharacterized protein n=1 Tax=Aporhodopirellula aestuarii TaxID=2950107 RepID=A0ABT0U3F7_9BACT|nr:hypothetical protein [Aporhodopirellula aestuarii]MCM2371431.1 hypothetical protein [Aporhodopirellula aestuarii]
MSQTQQTTEASSEWNTEPWSRLKESIHSRWPHISEQDLHSVPRNRDEIEKFLGEFTQASDEEIQSVVREHAPAPTILDQVGHVGEQISEQVTPPIQSAVDRVRYEVDEHPGTITGLAFVSGLALGALVTAAYMRARPQPPAYRQLLPERWQ